MYLQNGRFHIWQFGLVVHRGQTISRHHTVQFSLETFQNPGMIPQQYHGPAELGGNGLRSSRHEISKYVDQIFLIVLASGFADELYHTIVIIRILSLLALMDLIQEKSIPFISLCWQRCKKLAVLWQVHGQRKDVKERIEAVGL